jgi:hypothetical protein
MVSKIFRFGNEEDGWSRVYNFTSAPVVGTNKPLKILVFGDLSTGGMIINVF